MARGEVIDGTVPQWAGRLADGLDRNVREWHRIEARTVFLWLALLACVTVTAHIIRGRDAQLRRTFGELSDVLPLGVPVAAVWLFRDRRRRQAMAQENRAAWAQLSEAGLSYSPCSLAGSNDGRIRRVVDTGVDPSA